MATLVDRVGSFAFYSRILVIFMQAFFNYLLPDHDAGVFSPPSGHRMSRWDYYTSLLLGGFRRWDAVYFLHIAEHGYTYENCLAFFPLFPMVVRMTANTILFPLQYILNYPNVVLISAVLLNVFFFIYSAKYLYKLGVKVVGDEALAFKAAQLYCINPASVFFSAAYSESAFSCFAFAGMLNYENKRSINTSLQFGLSTFTRSNGLVNAGFLLYGNCMEYMSKLMELKKEELINLKTALIGVISLTSLTVCSTLLHLFICWSPYFIYQYYAYTIFCNPFKDPKELPSYLLRYGQSQDYRMPHSDLSPWCNDTIPMSYSYVQSTHWDIGFLKYYQLKQMPNFVLAAPMVVLCVSAAVTYMRKMIIRIKRWWLFDKDAIYKKFDMTNITTSEIEFGFENPKCFVYIVHMMVLVLFAVLFMHIQVVTRFIASSCPVIYWYISMVSTPPAELKRRYERAQRVADGGHLNTAEQANVTDDLLEWDNQCWLNRLIFIYFHLYFFVGIAAFSNFLPWT